MSNQSKYTLHPIHIDPDKDFLMEFDECYGGKRTHSKYFIEPYGPYQHNEMLDTIYIDPDHLFRYHEHEIGVETFLVDGGSVLMEICGKKAVATKGDIIHLPPFVPHQLTWLEPGTIWRELFQETHMSEDCLAGLRFKEYNKGEFDMSRDGQSPNSQYYTYTPVTVEVPKEEIYHIRPYNSGLVTYKFPGCELRLKVGRWETKGHKEIWQLCVDPGFELSWSAHNPFYGLFIVQEGKVEVRIDGMDKFVAKERDILHIPSNLSGEIVAPEGAVLFDYNCEGFGLRAVEELYSLYTADPKAAAEEAEGILGKHHCYVRGRLLK